jgi:predicted DNA-binding transcriptional regulator AlpA
MKHRSTQLGVRKNPDSPRVHGLRLTADSSSESAREFEKPRDRADPTLSPPRKVEVFDLPLTDTRVEIAVRDGAQFLTVQEVSLRLGVSRNWVYNHAETLGAYHLGKYLRFSWSRVLECLEK